MQALALAIAIAFLAFGSGVVGLRLRRGFPNATRRILKRHEPMLQCLENRQAALATSFSICSAMFVPG